MASSPICVFIIEPSVKATFIIAPAKIERLRSRLVRMHSDGMNDIESASGDIVALFGVECASATPL
jgi:hypothetical protein